MKRKFIRGDASAGYDADTLIRAVLRKDFGGAVIYGFERMRDLKKYVRRVGTVVAPFRNIDVRGYVSVRPFEFSVMRNDCVDIFGRE